MIIVVILVIIVIIVIILIWLVVSTPLKNMKVSWDDEIPNIWKSKIHVPNHQSVIIIRIIIIIIIIIIEVVIQVIHPI